MQSQRPNFDRSFAETYQWSRPEQDLQIVMLILDGHKDDEICPASLKRNDYVHVQKLLASNPNTPPQVLEHMAFCAEHPDVLERIATNPNASLATLKRLAQHENTDVRVAVAENPNVDLDLIILLAKDLNTDVRFRLAETHWLPEEILDQLCCDENPYVGYRAQMTKMRISNSSQPKKAHEFPNYREEEVRRAV